MKVLLINTNDSGGGAAIACNRLSDALNHQGVDVRTLVMNRNSNRSNVAQFKDGKFQKHIAFLRFAFERLFFLFHEKDKSVRFAFSPANFGTDITKHPWVKDSDIIHIHWINAGFLSLKSLEKLLQSNKTIVWTLHDMWLFSGGCHYAGSCRNFELECGNCHFLKKPNTKDLSWKIWKRKSNFMPKQMMNVVTCSRWLGKEAKASSLLKNANITSIPNPISLNMFKPANRADLKRKYNIEENKFVLLFGAANINDKRKGLHLLVEALALLKKKKFDHNRLKIVVFGKFKDFDEASLAFDVLSLGQIKNAETMAEVYSMSDVFVLPSLEDNLPNTVMESMACGTPVIAYNIGGIPEMVEDEKIGIVVDEVSPNALSEAIFTAVTEANIQQWCKNARAKVEEEYNYKSVATKYIDFYQNAMKNE